MLMALGLFWLSSSLVLKLRLGIPVLEALLPMHSSGKPLGEAEFSGMQYVLSSTGKARRQPEKLDP